MGRCASCHAGGPQTLSGTPTPARKYYFSNSTMNWYDAQYHCNINYGGTLVWFENEATHILYDSWLRNTIMANFGGAYGDYW